MGMKHAKRRVYTYLPAKDVREIFTKMNTATVMRGMAGELAHAYEVSINSIRAIATGRARHRLLGDDVEVMPIGLRAYKPENRDKALRRRGVQSQTVHYQWLKPLTNHVFRSKKETK